MIACGVVGGVENTDYRNQAGKAEIGVFGRFRPAALVHSFIAVGALCSEAVW